MRKLQGSWLEAFCSFASNTESPQMYFQWAALVFLGCALRRNIWIERPLYRDYPNLYVILVSPPGVTRKSTACDWGYDTIVKHVPAISKYTGRITTEALIDRLSALNACADNPAVLAPNPSLFLYASELSTLLKKMPKGCYPLLDFLTAVYGSGSFKSATKGGGEKSLNNICISLLGATTVSGMRDLIGEDGEEGGFTSRTILVYQDECIAKPWASMSSMSNSEVIADLINDLNHISELQGEMIVPAKVKRWFDTWYLPYRKGAIPTELRYYWSRRHDHLLKVAMLLAVAERDDLVLQIQDLEKALSMLLEVEKHMYKAYSSIGETTESKILNLILAYMKEQGGSIGHSKLLRKFQHKIKNATEFKSILSRLAESNLINIEAKGKGSKYTLIEE